MIECKKDGTHQEDADPMDLERLLHHRRAIEIDQEKELCAHGS